MSVHIFRVVYVCIVSMYVSYFFITPASQEGESFHPAGEHCIFDQIQHTPMFEGNRNYKLKHDISY